MNVLHCKYVDYYMTILMHAHLSKVTYIYIYFIFEQKMVNIFKHMLSCKLSCQYNIFDSRLPTISNNTQVPLRGELKVNNTHV